MSADPTNISRGERMFAHRRGAFKGLLTLVSSFVLIGFAGCGGGDSPTGPFDPRTADADPEDLAVIENWSEALEHGDVREAANFFAIPSVVQNGGPPVTISDFGEAVDFNRALPCGAVVIAASTEGDLTTATFRLSDRPGGDCGSGAGERAATAFEIEDGRIVQWLRVGTAPPAAGGGQGSLTSAAAARQPADRDAASIRRTSSTGTPVVD
jgi:hypothetical protein